MGISKFIVSAAAISAILGIGAASAADMAVKAPPPPVAICDWCGFYVGVNAGGIWSNDNNTYFGGDTTVGGTLSAIARGQVAGSLGTGSSGFIGGAQAGFNQQKGNFVWGIEGDLQGTSLSRSATFASNLAPAFFPATTTASEKMDVLATFRGRVGFTTSPMVLLYATGGLAVGDPRVSSALSTFPVPGGPAPAAPGCAGFCSAVNSSDDWRAGWTVGAGAEWKFNAKWSAKAEYLYYDLGRINQTGTDTLGRFPGTFYTASTRVNGSIARVGINYAFGGGPVVAKY
jgi:outer membrane immunogenic protein